MKTRSFLFLLAMMIFAAVSCTTETKENKTEITLETRGTKANVAGKWQSGTTWVNLKIDGTFEASFGGDATIIGNWSLVNEGKTLKLTGDKAAEGKGQSFNKEYTVIELSDAVMRVEDAEGNKLDLKSE